MNKELADLLDEAANAIAEEHGEDPEERDPIDPADDTLVGRLRLTAQQLRSDPDGGRKNL